MRVFTRAEGNDTGSEFKAQLEMTKLLESLRIKASVHLVRSEKLHQEEAKGSPTFVRMKSLAENVHHHHLLRYTNHLRKESSDAVLCIITMPLPSYGDSATAFLSWLEQLSVNMPPIIFVRGVNSNVLTPFL